MTRKRRPSPPGTPAPRATHLIEVQATADARLQADGRSAEVDLAFGYDHQEDTSVGYLDVLEATLDPLPGATLLQVDTLTQDRRTDVEATVRYEDPTLIEASALHLEHEGPHRVRAGLRDPEILWDTTPFDRSLAAETTQDAFAHRPHLQDRVDHWSAVAADPSSYVDPEQEQAEQYLDTLVQRLERLTNASSATLARIDEVMQAYRSSGDDERSAALANLPGLTRHAADADATEAGEALYRQLRDADARVRSARVEAELLGEDAVQVALQERTDALDQLEAWLQEHVGRLQLAANLELVLDLEVETPLGKRADTLSTPQERDLLAARVAEQQQKVDALIESRPARVATKLAEALEDLRRNKRAIINGHNRWARLGGAD
jgi:hypothetical protein